MGLVSNKLKRMKKTFRSMNTYERNSFFFVWEGAVGSIILNLANPFFSMFAKRMGAGDFHIGLLSSLPALIGILSLIPGAMMVDRRQDKKGIVAFYILFIGFLYPLAALTPYAGSFKVIIFIFVIALLNWPFTVFNIAWQSFFSDVLPPPESNIAYARRSKAATLFGALTYLLAGFILSSIPRTDEERVMIYQIFFILSFGLALCQAFLLYNVKGYELPEKDDSTSSLRMVIRNFKELIANKPFMEFTLVSLIFHFAWQMAWPIFFIYHVDYLHANEAWLSYIGVVNSLASVVTFSFWRKIIDKRGVKWTVMIGAAGLAFNPILTVSARSLFVVLLVNIGVGLTSASFQLSLFQNLMEVVPSRGKTMNIAIYTAMISISGFISPMIGVWIYQMTSIHVSMVFNGFLRFAAVGLFYWRYRISLKSSAEQNTISS